MSDKKSKEFDKINNDETSSAPENIVRMDDRRFSQRLEQLVSESESMRIKRMRQHRTRGFIAMNFSIFTAILGAAAFGWYFIIQLDIQTSLVCVLAPVIISILVYIWAAQPIKTYKREHKNIFMPKVAKALGGLNYIEKRGINTKILERSLVLPPHKVINSEDCFMGKYKDVKVIFSEARLYAKNIKGEPVFQGIFVLLEAAGDVFEGHTVITANKAIVLDNIKTRWKSMSQVYVSPSNPEWDIFSIYSSNPESAELIVGDRLLKELAEASSIFNNSPLTAVLFAKKYVFMMIPNNHDMFEASDLYVPITTHQHAVNCKKEIEQILEIIDVFDLYRPLKS